jgi:hypothetical protein
MKGPNGNEHTSTTLALTIGFFLTSAFFVWRSFYGMRIGGAK